LSSIAHRWGFWPVMWPGAGLLLAVVAAIVVERVAAVELSWASWIGSCSVSFDEEGVEIHSFG
jgi:hypothetical protein